MPVFKKYLRVIPCLCLCSLTLILSSCLSEEKKPIRVGLNAWPGYEFLYLAEQKGFYLKEDVPVKIVEFNSLSDARRAFEKGQIDLLGTTIVEVLQAADQSERQPKIIKVVDYSNGADIILSRSPIKSTEELRGKKVGVELASLGVYILSRGLEKGGLTLKDITPVSMDQLSMAEAFKNGELDAMVTYPPFSLKIMRETSSNTLFSTAEIPGEVIDVLAVDDSVLQNRKEDLGKIIRAFDQAINYAQTNPDDAYKIMAEREGLTPQEFLTALTDGMTLLRNADQKEYFQDQEKLKKVIVKTDRILRETSQIKGADLTQNLTDASFAR